MAVEQFAAEGDVRRPLPGEPLRSAQPLYVGKPDGRGPLAAGLPTVAVGSARAEGGGTDLFVVAGRHSSQPGLWRYRYLARDGSGAPVFSGKTRVPCPFGDLVPRTIVALPDGRVVGAWIERDTVSFARYESASGAFVAIPEGRTTITGLPRPASDVGILAHAGGAVDLLLGVSDGVRYQTSAADDRDKEYMPYDGAGIWHGGLPRAALWTVRLAGIPGRQAGDPRRLSETDGEVLSSFQGFAVADLGRGREIIAGSHMGNFTARRVTGDDPLAVEQRRPLVRADGVMHRHPVVWAAPVVWRDPETGRPDLIAGGEGHIWWYRFAERFSSDGNPIYAEPLPVLEEGAVLYPGSLSVPNVVDWDGDGRLDIVAGNSEGRILFFRNVGTNDAPAFLNGVPIESGGRAIHIQAEYRGSIQGPFEARWGYVCPTVVDWNGDGLPDIVMSDVTGRHTVYLNRGSRTDPRLDLPRTLHADGMPLHGTWRVKPGVAPMAGRLAYAMLDDDDEIHLYHRIDDENLEDIGKIRLADGRPIRANYLHAGGTGRLKINLVDWDGDGITDLLVGTPRHGSVPDPERGLPHALGLPGASVLFLRNVGSDAAPVFAPPELLHFRGRPMYFGQHACGPAVADFGGPGGPHLIVGDQEGKIWFFRREDVTP